MAESVGFVLFGAIAIALGTAAAWQGTLGHLSGVLLLIFRPFELGHKITVAGQTGVVSDIGLFATTMVAADNEMIIVPNGAITSCALQKEGIDVAISNVVIASNARLKHWSRAD